MPAFEYAESLGADTLELDLQVTKDGILMISHEPGVSPVICGGAPKNKMLHDTTADEVQKFDCGGKKNPRFPKQVSVPSTPIPRFSDFLKWVKGKKVQINVETKIYPAHPELSP